MIKVFNFLCHNNEEFCLGETLFCWVFAIASMLRQSLINFLEARSPPQSLFEKVKYLSALKPVMASLRENSFHKKLRDEILMIPIPKAKVNDSDGKTKFRFPKTEDREAILDKQGHYLKSAVERVSY